MNTDVAFGFRIIRHSLLRFRLTSYFLREIRVVIHRYRRILLVKAEGVDRVPTDAAHIELCIAVNELLGRESIILLKCAFLFSILLIHNKVGRLECTSRCKGPT